MLELEVFKFEATADIRVVVDNAGDPWFVLADICAALGLTNPSMVSARVREQLGDAALSLAEVSSGGQRRQATIVSEPGLYEVIFRSDRPEAAAFRRWVTTEVLPQIRRTGSYSIDRLDPTTPQGMRMVLQAAVAAMAELDAVRPKAEAWDELAATAGDYAVADAAKLLARAGIKTGQTRLFATLADYGWIYRSSGRWRAYQRAVDAGLLAHKMQAHYHPQTSDLVTDPPQIRVTVKGVKSLRDRMRANEPLPELST